MLDLDWSEYWITFNRGLCVLDYLPYVIVVGFYLCVDLIGYVLLYRGFRCCI